jgi:polysaccharide pyruvyl transferase WcaK-like protein
LVRAPIGQCSISGRLHAFIDAAEFGARARLVNYQKVAQAAVEEVVDAIRRYCGEFVGFEA